MQHVNATTWLNPRDNPRRRIRRRFLRFTIIGYHSRKYFSHGAYNTNKYITPALKKKTLREIQNASTLNYPYTPKRNIALTN